MKKLILAAVIGAIAALSMPSAQAVATLRITDGIGADYTFVDNGPEDTDSTLGIIKVNEVVGVFNVSTAFGQVTTGPSQSSMKLSSVETTSSQAGTLTIQFSQSGFAPNAGPFSVLVSGTTSGTGSSFNLYANASNTLLDVSGGAIYSSGPLTGAFSDSSTAAAVAGTPYSMTLEAVVSHSAAGSQVTSFSMQAATSVPDGGSTLLLLGGAFGLLGFASWRRRS